MSDKKTVGGQRTKKRAFIHAFMINYQRQHGRPPTLATIAEHFDSGKTPVYMMLLRMVEAGSVKHDYGHNPAFTAIETPAVNGGGAWYRIPHDATGEQE